MATTLADEAAALAPQIVALRRDLHAHPELAFKETRTAGIVAERLEALGLEVRTGVGQTGVVGLLRGARPGKTVALRADIDALPIEETNDAGYRSVNPGVMHAWGHDGHTAAVLAAAEMLARRRDTLAGNVKFIFQPAEEMAAGAPAMIEDGVLEDPAVDAIFAFHLWNFLPAGAVGLRAGPIWASVDRLRIKIMGRGGHAATPHQTIDPIPTASQVVLALQTLVSRESRLGSPAVLSVTSLQAGTTWNVIPGEAVLQGTLRTFDHAQRDVLVERAEDIVRGICLAARAEYEFTSEYLAPPVVNDEAMTELVRGVAARELGPECVASVEQAALGDDMAFFLDRVPGCYIMMGSRNEARGLTQGHHNAAFDFDESVLPTAARLLAATALDSLGES